MFKPLVTTDAKDSSASPMDFDTVHKMGIPHRAVHIEIIASDGRYFVWHRPDGRLEIPGGHVDWIESESKPETYEEAALRELDEELNLKTNWNMATDAVYQQLQPHISAIAHIVNQLPSSHGNNNEWVTVFRLDWKSDWNDPCQPEWQLSDEGMLPNWLSISDMEQSCMQNPMSINAALRLLLRRHGILVPLIKQAFI